MNLELSFSKTKRKFALELTLLPFFRATTMYRTYSILGLEPMSVGLNLCTDFTSPQTGWLKVNRWCHFFSTHIALTERIKCECESSMMAQHELRAGVVWPFSPSLCPQQKNYLVNPTGEFLLCSRPLEALAIRKVSHLEHSHFGWFRVTTLVRVCVRYLYVGVETRVLKVSNGVRQTLELW